MIWYINIIPFFLYVNITVSITFIYLSLSLSLALSLFLSISVSKYHLWIYLFLKFPFFRIDIFPSRRLIFKGVSKDEDNDSYWNNYKNLSKQVWCFIFSLQWVVYIAAYFNISGVFSMCRRIWYRDMGFSDLKIWEIVKFG